MRKFSRAFASTFARSSPAVYRTFEDELGIMNDELGIPEMTSRQKKIKLYSKQLLGGDGFRNLDQGAGRAKNKIERISLFRSL